MATPISPSTYRLLFLATSWGFSETMGNPHPPHAMYLLQFSIFISNSNHYRLHTIVTRPQRSWDKVMFSQACVILFTGGGRAWLLGVCVAAGGCAWLPGGVHGCQGVCVVAGGHAWLPRGMCGCWGACMVAGWHVWLPGGMCDCWGHAWLLGVCGCWGACMVARGLHGCWGVYVVAGGHAWQKGGVHGEGGTCMAKGGHTWQRGGVHGIRRDMEIRSMSGRYASYWNVFLLITFSKH